MLDLADVNPASVDVLRETVKVTKFELPPDAVPETTKRSKGVVPLWERQVAAALWVLAAVIIAMLYCARTT